MTEKQYSKKKLFERLTLEIPGTTIITTKVVVGRFVSKRVKQYSDLSQLILDKIKNLLTSLFIQAFTNKQKNECSFNSKLFLRKTNLNSPFLNYNSKKLPYNNSNKENASSLADYVFFNFLIIQEPVV